MFRFLLPWPRLALLIRSILETRWDPETWPTAKAELASALKLLYRVVGTNPDGTEQREPTRLFHDSGGPASAT